MTLEVSDPSALALQLKRQQKFAWNFEKDINWEIRVDASKYLVPLDKDCVVFPGASSEQRLVLSQFFGLAINSSISEIENLIVQLQEVAWAKALRESRPHKDMWDLGLQFFTEERKHALLFERYNAMFAECIEVDPQLLKETLPNLFGTRFSKAMNANAEAGGAALWWAITAVEEVSLQIYAQIRASKTEVDPLYFEVHLHHMEEEARHQNYPFLMLEMYSRRSAKPRAIFHRKTDLLFSQIYSTTWICSELWKAFGSGRRVHNKPFFKVLASCRALFDSLSVAEIAKRVFSTSPYLSLLINSRSHPLTRMAAQKQGAYGIPFPKSEISPTFAEIAVPEESKKIASGRF